MNTTTIPDSVLTTTTTTRTSFFMRGSEAFRSLGKHRFIRFYIFHSLIRILSYLLSLASILLVWWKVIYSPETLGYADGSPYLSHICGPVTGNPYICMDTVFHDTPEPLLHTGQMIGFISLITVLISFWIIRIFTRVRLIRQLRNDRNYLRYVQEQEILLTNNSTDNNNPSLNIDTLLNQSKNRQIILKYFILLDFFALFFQLLGFIGFTNRTKVWFETTIVPAAQAGNYTVTYYGVGKTPGTVVCLTAIICSIFLLITTNIVLFRERKIYKAIEQQQQDNNNQIYPNRNTVPIPSAPTITVISNAPVIQTITTTTVTTKETLLNNNHNNNQYIYTEDPN